MRSAAPVSFRLRRPACWTEFNIGMRFEQFRIALTGLRVADAYTKCDLRRDVSREAVLGNGRKERCFAALEVLRLKTGGRVRTPRSGA